MGKLLKLRLPAFGRSRHTRPRGPVTALDVDGQLLRVVQTRWRPGQVKVSRVAMEQLEMAETDNPSDPVVLGKAIAKALVRARIKSTPVVMGIPRALVVLRTLSLPAVEDPRELASVVHFQIAKDLPFPAADAVIDFKVRPQLSHPPNPPPESAVGREGEAAPPKLNVLVAAVKREVVDFYRQTTAAAGLTLLALGFRPYANARCVEACRLAEDEESVGFVSLRPDEVLVDVIAQRDLVFSRGSTTKVHSEESPTAYVTDSQMPEENEASGLDHFSPVAHDSPRESQQALVEAITIEVVRSFHSFGGMEVTNPVTKLVIAGATGNELEVAQALETRLKIPCSLLEPDRALDLPLEARGYASGAIAALGLGLGIFDSTGLPFDFLNPKRPAVRRNMRRIKILSGAAAAAALIMMLAGVEFYLLRGKQRIQDALTAELTVENGRRDLYRRMRLQAKVINNWITGGKPWLDHYAFISSVLPSCEDVYLTSFTVSSRGNINLAIQARSGEVLADVEKRLSAAGYTVQPLPIKPGKDKFGYPFRSGIELLVPDTMKIDLSKLTAPPRPADDGSLDARKGGGA